MADPTVRLAAIIVTAALFLLAAELVKVTVVVHLPIFPILCPLTKHHCHFTKIFKFLKD
jgi:hypothetical protein